MLIHSHADTPVYTAIYPYACPRMTTDALLQPLRRGGNLCLGRELETVLIIENGVHGYLQCVLCTRLRIRISGKMACIAMYSVFYALAVLYLISRFVTHSLLIST